MKMISKEEEVYAELIRVMECEITKCARNSIEYYIYSYYVENQFDLTTREEVLERIYEITLTMPDKHMIPTSAAKFIAGLSISEHDKLKVKMEDTIKRMCSFLFKLNCLDALSDCVSLFKRHSDIANKIDKYNNAILIREKLKEFVACKYTCEFGFTCILVRLNALMVGLAWLNGDAPTVDNAPKDKALHTLNYIYERLMQINAVLGINAIDELCVLLHGYMKENDEVIGSILKSLNFFKMFFNINQYLSSDNLNELRASLPIIEHSVEELSRLCETAMSLEDSISRNAFRGSLYQSQLFNDDLFKSVTSNLNFLGMVGVLDHSHDFDGDRYEV